MTSIRYNCPVDVDCPFSVEVDASGLLGYSPTCWEPELYSHITNIHQDSLLIDPCGVRFRDTDNGRWVSLANPAESNPDTRSGTNSEASSHKARSTRYCCPLKDCTFSIDKAGLMGGEAASHISKIHKVTAEAMKTAPKGYYKFKKVKAEAGA